MTVWSNTVKGQSLGINSWFERNGNSVTLKQEIRYRSTTPVTDSTNVLNWNGHVTGSISNALKVTYWTGETVLTTLSTPITIPRGSNINRTLNASISNVDYVGGTLYVTDNVSYTGFPNDITGASTSRVSDTQANVTWTNNHGSTGYSGVRIDRYTSGSGWTNIATIAGNATSYSDHSLTADKQYRYALYGQTSTGLSANPSLTGYIYTTPAAPTGLTASKSGSTINLSWTNRSGIATGVEVSHGVGNPVVWDLTPLATLGASATSYSHSSADPSKIHTYRVRATVASLGSAYAISNAVQLQAPPLAPAVSSPNVIDFAVTPLTVTWVHNPVDSSAQTNAQLRYRPVGGSWTNVYNKFTNTSHTWAPGTFANGTTYEFQVCTKGDATAFGPWSTSVLVLGSSTPTVSFTPSGTYGQSTLTVNLSYFQAESSPMAGAVLTLRKDGQAIEGKYSSSTTIVFNTKLDNNSTYMIEAKVVSGHGLLSNAVVNTINTAFPNPPKPTIALSFDADAGQVAVSVATGIPVAGEVDADFVEVYRYDGVWTLIGTTETNGSLVDTIPPLNKEVAYKAVAVSDTPSSTDSNLGYVDTTSPWIFLNGGPGFATRARLKADASVDLTVGRAKVLHTFAGNKDSTEFVGESRTNEYKIQGRVAGFELDRARYGNFVDFEVIADLPAPICYRDPMGRRVMGSLSDVSIRHETTSEFASVSFSLTKVQS